MGFQISAGVYTNEIDLTNVVTSVGTTAGALAGVFRWGPVGQRVLVNNQKDYADIYGKPSNFNAETWFTGANFLDYTDGLYVNRVANTTANSTSIAGATLSAVAIATGTVSNTQLATSVVRNSSEIDGKTFDAAIPFVAKYPGALGNSLKISIVDNATAYNSTVNLVPNSDISGNSSVTYTVGSNLAVILLQAGGSGTGATTLALANTIVNTLKVGDYVKVGNTTTGVQYAKVTDVATPTQSGSNASVVVSLDRNVSLVSNFVANTVDRTWEYYQNVNKTPGQTPYQKAFGNTAVNDEVHIVVSDQDGLFTGVPGTILEVYESLSRASDAKDESGTSIFYKNVLNTRSKYIWAGSDLTAATTNTSLLIVNSTSTTATAFSLIGGQDGPTEGNVALGEVAKGYDAFIEPNEVEVGIVLQGMAKGGTNGTGLANYIISNVIESRKDCMLVVSGEKADVVNAAGFETENLSAFRNSLSSTSYAVMDSGYKWQYDKYNDVYRYIPLNGDIGGLIARNDVVGDVWTSPAGETRGVIKNVVKLAWNPNFAQRELLYKADINPVVSVQNKGTYLNGDKTLLGKNSAFSRINVRRLFITLEKSIARASTALLFELNDEFTRAQFRNMVEPYLREIQGRRGITDFRVVCDETNNTPQVIDNNGFAGDVYIKPARSINTIQLNFIAARTGVEFSEIVGKF